MPLPLPKRVLGDAPAPIAVHLVFVGIARDKLSGLDGAVADVLEDTACTQGTRHLVDHHDVGGWLSAIVSDPDPGLGRSAGIGGTTTDLVLEAGDAELGVNHLYFKLS